MKILECWVEMVEGQVRRLQQSKHISLSSVCDEQALLGAGQGNISAADFLCDEALRTIKLPEQWQVAFLAACTCKADEFALKIPNA